MIENLRFFDGKLQMQNLDLRWVNVPEIKSRSGGIRLPQKFINYYAMDETLAIGLAFIARQHFMEGGE